MSIPLGTRHHYRGEFKLQGEFHCNSCGHEAVAEVIGYGEGFAQNLLFLNPRAADLKAISMARDAAKRQAVRIMQLAPCPKCGLADQHASAAHRRSKQLAPLEAAAIGVAFGLLAYFLVAPSVGVLGGLALAAVMYFILAKELRRLSQRVERVTFADAPAAADKSGSAPAPACPQCNASGPHRVSGKALVCMKCFHSFEPPVPSGPRFVLFYDEQPSSNDREVPQKERKVRKGRCPHCGERSRIRVSGRARICQACGRSFTPGQTAEAAEDDSSA